MLLPLLLALSSVVVTPERPISPPVLQAAAGVQQNPAVASDGDGWLAAWRSEGEIVAARIDESGTVLDRAPIEIDGVGSFVAVASGPAGYLVVWSGHGPSVRARLVDRDGRLGPVTTLSNTAQDAPVAAAFTGGEFLVTWADSHPAQMAMLLDARGTPLALAPSSLKVIDGAVNISAVAGGVNGFLIAGDLADARLPVGQAFAVRIGIDGFVSAPFFLSDSASPVTRGSVRAAWNGAEYFAAWSTNQGALGETHGARVGAENRVLLTPSFYAGTARLSDLAWNGSEYLATLVDGTSVLTQRVARAGEPEEVSNVVAQPLNLGVSTAAASWNGQSMLIAYGTGGAVAGDVWAKLTDGSGAPRDPERQRPGIAVALSPPGQSAPSVTAGIAGSAVVWSEELPEEGASVHLMTFLLGDTTPQGRGAIVSEGGSPARIAFAGTAFALIDSQPFVQPSVQVGRIDSLQSRRVALSTLSGVVDDVVWGGETFLVTAAEIIPAIGGYKRQLGIALVTPDGAATTPIDIGEPLQATSASSLASNGDGALAVWVRNRALEASVVGHRALPSGVIPIASDIGSATVRWNGRAYVIAALAADRSAVRWFVVNANGTLLSSSDAVPVAAPALDANAVRPRSASFGETTLVAWIDDNDIRGALIRSDDGSPLGEPFLIATANAPRYLDMDGEGDTIRVVYQAESPYPGVPHLTRVYTRTVALAPAPLKRRAVK